MAKRKPIVDYRKFTSPQLRQIIRSKYATAAGRKKAYGILIERNAVHNRGPK